MALGDDPNRPYLRKFARAVKHLQELKLEVIRYETDCPCVPVRDRKTDPNPRIWKYRAYFPNKPSPELPFIVGDFVHNLRTALNYLAAALVSPERKDDWHLKFPIERKDIWALDPETGKQVESLSREREEFIAALDGMIPDAWAFIERLQPYHERERPELHSLAVLSALDNADKHYEMATIAFGIEDPVTTLTSHEGEFAIRITGEGVAREGEEVATFVIRPHELKAHGMDPEMIETVLATLADGNAEVDVKVTGTPVVALEIAGLDEKVAPLPESFERLVEMVREDVIRPLDWYVEVAEAGGIF